jgi:plastocyanin
MNVICHYLRHSFLFKAGFLSATALIFGGALSGFAASTTVTVGSPTDKFSPAVVTINAGDSVIWTWAAGNHSSTSGTNGVASGLWGSGVLPLNSKFTNAFPTAGTYRYYCSVHFGSPFFMTGAVMVASANLPPTATITNPPPGKVFAAPANVTLQASATDSDGSVTNVQFRVGSTVLANDSTAPYAAVTNNMPAGNYTLFAIASDNNGATGTNQVSISVVNPVTVLLSAPQPVPTGKFRFSYTADTGLNYIVQRSTNLVSTNWISLATNTAGSSLINFTDLNATLSREFYRVGRLPNP